MRLMQRAHGKALQQLAPTLPKAVFGKIDAVCCVRCSASCRMPPNVLCKLQYVAARAQGFRWLPDFADLKLSASSLLKCHIPWYGECVSKSRRFVDLPVNLTSFEGLFDR